MEVACRAVLSMVTLLAFVACWDDTPKRWEKPNRVVNVSADARKALRISGSSSIVSTYGPLAGILNELLPRDMSDLSGELNDVDWSRDICIWTFDTEVNEVSVRGSTLLIKPVHQEGTGIRFWFFQKASLGKVKKIKFE